MIQNVSDMSKDTIFKLRLDESEREQLEAIAKHHGVSSAQMVRELIKREAEGLGKENHYRVSAWDGMHTTCLFWFGGDREEAVAVAKQLAKQHEGGRWTVFRAYRGDEHEPFFRQSVTDAHKRTRK